MTRQGYRGEASPRAITAVPGPGWRRPAVPGAGAVTRGSPIIVV